MCQQGLTFTVRLKSEQTLAVWKAVWLSSDPGTRFRAALPRDSNQTVTLVLITRVGQTTPIRGINNTGGGGTWVLPPHRRQPHNPFSTWISALQHLIYSRCELYLLHARKEYDIRSGPQRLFIILFHLLTFLFFYYLIYSLVYKMSITYSRKINSEA